MSEIDEWVDGLALADSTVKSYRYVVGRFLGWLEAGGREGATVTAGDLRGWLRETGWGNSLSYLAGCAVRKYLAWKYGEKHAGLGFRVRRKKSAPQRTLKPAQVTKVLESFDTTTGKGKRDLALLCLLLDTGLRASEVCRLQVKYLDLEERRLSVLVKGGEWGSAIFSDYTAACLAAWLPIRAALAGSGVDTVFVSVGGLRPGTSLTATGLRCITRKWGQAAGVVLSPHDLRRTFAVFAVRAGAPSKLLMTAGRWKNLEMVDRYTRDILAEDFRPYLPAARLLER